MNRQRRKQLKDLRDRVEAIASLLEGLDPIREELELVRDEEQEYYDNMPESLQGSERGESSQAAIDAMELALGLLDDFKEAADAVTEAIEHLECAEAH